MTKALKIRNTSERALALARCLIGSEHLWEHDPHEFLAHELVAVTKHPTSPFVLQFIDGFTSTDTLILPIETLKLDPFIAIEQNIPVVVDFGVFGKEKILGGELLRFCRNSQLPKCHLDLNAACQLDGVELVEI